jgi:hypothetical protein
VLPEPGAMAWSRAMGTAACQLACRYLRDETSTRTVFDPFCGRGSVLAVASSLGFDVIGVDLSAKRCRATRAMLANLAHPGDSFELGAEHFNAGRYFEAHDAWEERWRSSQDEAERRLLQGLIQIAAGLHKYCEMNSLEPALRLLAKGIAKLDACPEHSGAFDVAGFTTRMKACAQALASGTFAPADLPRVG